MSAEFIHTHMNSSSRSEIATVPHILMVTHVLPYPPAAGNEIRIYKMLKWFQQKGYRVTLVLKPLGEIEVTSECIVGIGDMVENIYVFDNRSTSLWFGLPGNHGPRPVDTDINDPKLREIQDGFCPPWFVEEVAAIVSSLKPDVVIAQYIFMSRILMLPECGNALRFIDAHDLFCRKQATVEQYGIKNYGLSLSDEEERQLLMRSDTVLAIQRTELEEIMKLVPERKALLASFDIETHVTDSACVVPGQVLIIASSNEFNIRGTQDFLDYTWPLVREGNPIARLRVVGRVCCGVYSDDPTVDLLGFIENLDSEYEQAAVVVNPCRVGTGLKIKTIEALAWGKAHVAWPSAADGLRELGDVPAIIATNVVTFADGILYLISDSPKREALQEDAHRFISEHFGASIVYADLAREIESIAFCDTKEVRIE